MGYKDKWQKGFLKRQSCHTLVVQQCTFPLWLICNDGIESLFLQLFYQKKCWCCIIWMEAPVIVHSSFHVADGGIKIKWALVMGCFSFRFSLSAKLPRRFLHTLFIGTPSDNFIEISSFIDEGTGWNFVSLILKVWLCEFIYITSTELSCSDTVRNILAGQKEPDFTWS